MATATTPDMQALATAAQHLRAGKYFQISGFVVLLFDHMLTFSEEVERIWKGKMSGAAILFLINRYVTPLQFIIIVDAFNDPVWTPSACRRFVAFEGASTVALIAVCELIMILRVYALYGRSIPILASLLFLWVCQIVISSVGLSSGFALDLPPGFIGCIFSSTSPTFPSLWVAPLVTDTLIFALTLLRTRRYVAWSGTNLTLEVFMRDGAMYFLVIFIANLANTLLYFLAPADLKAIGASFSQLITSTMVSRLVLNLRSAATYTSFESAHRPLSLMEKTVGHLGEGIEYSREDDQVYGGTDDHDIPLTPLRRA